MTMRFVYREQLISHQQLFPDKKFLKSPHDLDTFQLLNVIKFLELFHIIKGHIYRRLSVGGGSKSLERDRLYRMVTTNSGQLIAGVNPASKLQDPGRTISLQQLEDGIRPFGCWSVLNASWSAAFRPLIS